MERKKFRPVNMDEVKTIQVGILREIKVFCEQNKIKFYMIYGDYTKFPSEEERVTHHSYTAYLYDN